MKEVNERLNGQKAVIERGGRGGGEWKFIWKERDKNGEEGGDEEG